MYHGTAEDLGQGTALFQHLEKMTKMNKYLNTVIVYTKFYNRI